MGLREGRWLRVLLLITELQLSAYKKPSYSMWMDQIISETLGQQFVGGYVALPAVGIRGGVIIGCSVDYYLIQDIQIGEFTVSATVKCREHGILWSITGVYGPQLDTDANFGRERQTP